MLISFPYELPLLLTGALLLLIAVYPFTIFPLLLIALRPILTRLTRTWWVEPGNSPPIQSAAIIICAHNEEAMIQAKLENALAVRAASPVPVAIYLYLDGCTDRTDERVSPYEDQVTVIRSACRTGKSRGIKTLMQQVVEDIVLFTDANVMLRLDVITRSVRAFAGDHAVGCLAGRVIFDNRNSSSNTRTEALYWQMEDMMRRAENEIGSCLCGTGALFVIRRELFVAPPDDIIDDFHTTLNVLLARRKVLFDHRLTASEPAAAVSRDEFRRKTRISCRAFNCFRLLRRKMRQMPLTLRWIFVSHKLLRWLSGFTLFTGAAFFAAGLLIASLTAILPLVFGMATVLFVGWLVRHRKVIGVARAGLAALAATSVGIFLSLRGERFTTWEPAGSARGTLPHTESTK